MAKLFLESTDTQYVVSNSNTAIFGAAGNQAVILDGDLTGITLNSNVERVEFDGATSDYTYKQTGTQLEVYNKAGVKVTSVGLTSTGSQLTFAEGTVTAKIVAPTTAGTAPTVSFGDQTVSATTAAAVTVSATAIDKTISSAPAPVFSVSSAVSSVTEASGAVATFTVSLNAAQPEATTVTLGLSGVGTATATDYGSLALAAGSTATFASNVLTFPAGTTTATFTVPVSTDTLTETGEGVKLTLSAPSTGASVAAIPYAEVLINDPPAPVFSLSAAATTVLEGNTTANTIPLTITRSGDTASATSVVLQTTAGTGTTGASASDFTAISQTVSFAAGETTKTVNFSTVADTTRETDETLTVSLGTPAAGSTIDATASSLTLTITNDDANLLPVITVPTTTPSAFIGSTATAITGISFTDGDDNTGFTVTVQAAGTSQVSFGTAATSGAATRNAAGVAVQNDETANALTITGPLAGVQSVLSSLKYTSNSTVPTSESVTITVTDAAGGVATKTVAVNIGKSGTLTSSNDSLLGSAGDDQFTGTVMATVLQTTDTIDGGLGVDKLTLTTVTGSVPAAAVTNVEVLDLALTGNTTVTLSTTAFGSALNTVNVAGDFTLSGNFNAGTTFNYAGAATQQSANTLTVSGINGTQGTADAFTVNLGSSANGATLANISAASGIIDSLTINSTGTGTVANTVTTLAGVTLGTGNGNLTLGGTQQLTIGTLPVTTGLISGANASGKLVLTAGAGATKLTGGSAGDVLTGNSGNYADSITGGAGNDTIDGGAGADTLIGGTGADVLKGNTSGVKTFVFSLGDSLTTARDEIQGLKTDDKIILDTTFGWTGTADVAIATGTAGTNAAVKEVFVNTSTNRIVIETAVDGSTFEEITIPAAYVNAPFTYKAASGSNPAYLLVGAAPLSAVNNAAGKLTLSGQPVTNVAVVISDNAPTVAGSAVGSAAVRTLDASLVTAYGINVTGSTGNDTITASAQADTINAGAGNDVITVGTGNDLVILHSVVATSSDSVGTANNTATGTGGDTLTGFDLSNDTIKVVATNVNNFVHAIDTAIGTATGTAGTGVFGDFAATVGLISLNDTDDDVSNAAVKYTGTGDLAINFATPTGTFNKANFEARLQYDLTGTAGADTITGGALADTITGGAGADTIDVGTGLDRVILAAGDTALTVSLGSTGASNASLTGLDTVTGLARSDGSVVSEVLDVPGTASLYAPSGTVDIATTNDVHAFVQTSAAGDTDVAFKSLTVSNGIVTFHNNDTPSAPGTVITVTTANAAGAISALQAIDLGDTGATAAFAVGSDLYVFTQGSDAGTDNSLDTLVKLVGQSAVDALIITTNTAGANDLFIA